MIASQTTVSTARGSSGLMPSECCSCGGLSAQDLHGVLQALEAARIKSQTSGLLRAFDAFKEGIMICSSASPGLEILFFNDAWCKMTGRLFLSCPHGTEAPPRREALAYSDQIRLTIRPVVWCK